MRNVQSVFVKRNFARRSSICQERRLPKSVNNRCSPGVRLICAKSRHSAAKQSASKVLCSPKEDRQSLSVKLSPEGPTSKNLLKQLLCVEQQRQQMPARSRLRLIVRQLRLDVVMTMLHVFAPGMRKELLSTLEQWPPLKRELKTHRSAELRLRGDIKPCLLRREEMIFIAKNRSKSDLLVQRLSAVASLPSKRDRLQRRSVNVSSKLGGVPLRLRLLPPRRSSRLSVSPR